VVAFGSSVGALVHNEVQANAQYTATHLSLTSLQHHLKVVLADVTSARRGFDANNSQLHQVTALLANDTAQLQAAQTELGDAQGHVAAQGISINDLHSCLGGVEQALNALSVGDQGSAIAALDLVAASCLRAVAPIG
jgi:hypothetical protein